MLDRGEPILWSDLYSGKASISFPDVVPYNINVTGDATFSSVVREFHMSNGWAIPDDAVIITGLGSTQVIMGLIQAFGSTYYSRPITYPDYKMMVDVLRYQWVTDPHVEIVTSPNNPDGSIQSPTTNADAIIWDMVYAWPWYGYDHGKLARHSMASGRSSILVFSCSKSIGLGGARVGYGIVPREVVVRYPHLLGRYRDYVILSTQGVDTPGQQMASQIMRKMQSFPVIRNILVRRFDELSILLRRRVPGLEILSPRGFYYMWVRRLGVNLYKMLPFDGLDGTLFGATNEYVRINMCCGIETYDRIIMLLS